MTEFTFRHFLAHGHRGHRATMTDWSTHLTTLFPETRLKGYIEVRSADSQSPETMLALPALIKGLFYDADCLGAAWDLVKGWSWEERVEGLRDANRVALRARIRRISLTELAREVLDISTTGLERQRVLNAQGKDESIYLERLAELVRRGLCPADRIIEKWTGEWRQEVGRLVEGSSYRIAA